ncbi:hypothetical protein NHQ30_008548 [Ciborinia camelliae]|nr:hypothetical protein NHQ30_008548 [Ciborinia camelliae]
MLEMHPQTFDILRMETSLSRMQLFETYDPFVIGVDHNLNPFLKESHAFCLFPKLPPELQLMIWATAADDRQIVRIKACAEDGSGEGGFWADYTMPVILHVCQDSRKEALKRYTLSFEGILRNPIYFNYQRDFLNLVGDSTCEHFEILSGEDNTVSGDIQKVENVLQMSLGLGSGVSEEEILVGSLGIWDGIKRLVIAERVPTWWGTTKEIWSDREIKKFSRQAKANHNREGLIKPGFPEVRIVKLDDVFDAVSDGEHKSFTAPMALQIKNSQWNDDHSILQKNRLLFASEYAREQVQEQTQVLQSQPTMSDAKAATFTLFQDLPRELQLKIWESASEKPRFIASTRKAAEKEEAVAAKERNQFSSQPTDLIEGFDLFEIFPGFHYKDNALCLLWTCHDAREIAKKTRSQPLLKMFGNPVYINFEIDIIICGSLLEYLKFFYSCGLSEEEIFAIGEPFDLEGPCDRNLFSRLDITHWWVQMRRSYADIMADIMEM